MSFNISEAHIESFIASLERKEYNGQINEQPMISVNKTTRQDAMEKFFGSFSKDYVAIWYKVTPVEM